jgi:hypothetical protein
MTSIVQITRNSLFGFFLINPLLAQDASESTAPPAAFSPVFVIVWLLVVVLMVAAMWKVFTKAGQPGWAAIIPIVNIYFLCKVAGRPGWWVILTFIPLVNLIIWIVLCVDVAKNFGKGAGFGIGLALLGFIFFPILGFGSAQYQGQAAGA